MKKAIIILTLLSLSLTACASAEKEKKEEELQKAYEQMQEESRIKNQQKKESSEYLFGFLQIDDFTIDNSGSKPKAKARLTNNYSGTLVGHIGLVVYDKDMNILDTQYVALPSVGVKYDESFLVDEYIQKEDYYTLKFADADMLHLK